jgi:phosphoglycolate phosphatase
MDLSDAVIAFDLDGTLVDTAPDLAGTMNAILEREGLAPLPLSAVRGMIGHGARALLAKGFAANGVDLAPERADRLFAAFLDHYHAHIADASRPFAGVETALDVLAAAGARLAVCTNKPTALSERLLAELGLAQRFAAIIGPDRAPAPKPDARHLQYTLAQAGGARRALMVGDSATDRDAARNAGTPVVLVSFGYTEIPAADLAPDRLIHHFDELVPAVWALLG